MFNDKACCLSKNYLILKQTWTFNLVSLKCTAWWYAIVMTWCGTVMIKKPLLLTETTTNSRWQGVGYHHRLNNNNNRLYLLLLSLWLSEIDVWFVSLNKRQSPDGNNGLAAQSDCKCVYFCFFRVNKQDIQNNSYRQINA